VWGDIFVVLGYCVLGDRCGVVRYFVWGKTCVF